MTDLNALDAVPEDVIAFIKSREGFKPVVYLDSLGLPTAGMGHLLTGPEKALYRLGDAPPASQLDAWAQADTAKAYKAARAQASQLKGTGAGFVKVLTSVNFQLGIGWAKKFPKAWAFMLAGKWELAAVEVQDSAWFKQTPVRVKDFQAVLRAQIQPPKG